MKKILFTLMVSILFAGNLQGQSLTEKLSSLFFDLSFGVDIDILRIELRSDPDFRFYHDPNRDTTKTIIGTYKQSENLNPICFGNQVIIQYSTAKEKKNKKVSLKWSMNYKLEDLPSARLDFEKLKTDYKPFFKDFSETKKTGAQKEMINTLTLKQGTLAVTIKLIEYANFSHLVSFEYQDTWKIEPVSVLKVKY